MNFQVITEWANKNKYRFTPNGFGRQYGDLLALCAPAEVWQIKERIVKTHDLHSALPEPFFKDYCGYITEGGAIHKHQDPNQGNKIHTRFNVMISKPVSGGIPVIDGKEIQVEEGDVWKCEAGLYEHWCTPVIGDKPRIVLSFGFLI